MKKIFLFLLFFAATERFCHWQTGGFALAKIESTLPYHSEWDTAPLSREEEQAIGKILDQPFRYLGSGKQFFAFESEDGKTVIKFIKHSTRRRPDTWLNHVRFPFFDQWRQSVVQHREKAISALMKSCKVAYDSLKEETGLLYAHLNKSKTWNKQLTIRDNLGIVYQIDLDSTEFLLQRKAESFASAFQGEKNVDALFHLVSSHCRKGVANLDMVIYRNLGVSEGKILAIDFGSLHVKEELKTPAGFKREVFLELLSAREWIATEHPQLLAYFDEKLQTLLHSSV